MKREFPFLAIVLVGLLLSWALYSQTQISSSQTHFNELAINGGSFAAYINQGAPPANTVYKGVTWDAVIFLDQADSKLKILKKDGTIVSLE